MATLPENITKPGWGVGITIPTLPTAIVTDWEQSDEVSSEVVRDQNGAVVEQEIYDHRYTVSATLQIPKGTESPKAGDRFAVEGRTWVVVSARVVQNNQTFRKLALQLESYENWPKNGGAA